jgi:hypothetical protein
MKGNLLMLGCLLLMATPTLVADTWWKCSDKANADEQQCWGVADKAYNDAIARYKQRYDDCMSPWSKLGPPTVKSCVDSEASEAGCTRDDTDCWVKFIDPCKAEMEPVCKSSLDFFSGFAATEKQTARDSCVTQFNTDIPIVCPIRATLVQSVLTINAFPNALMTFSAPGRSVVTDPRGSVTQLATMSVATQLSFGREALRNRATAAGLVAMAPGYAPQIAVPGATRRTSHLVNAEITAKTAGGFATIAAALGATRTTNPPANAATPPARQAAGNVPTATPAAVAVPTPPLPANAASPLVTTARTGVAMTPVASAMAAAATPTTAPATATHAAVITAATTPAASTAKVVPKATAAATASAPTRPPTDFSN